MAKLHWLVMAALLVSAAGCGDDDGRGDDEDSGPGVDAGMDAGFIRPDGSPPIPDTGPRVDGCVPAMPPIEICGDFMDQNCDGRETSCGDSDGDMVEACRAGEDLTMCDCDDSNPNVRPARGGLPGAPEACDTLDNDCNGYPDDAAACCPGCASIHPDRYRADRCLPDGACDCTTVEGIGPCDPGMHCCNSGCADIQNDFMNCGTCNAQCTEQADRCVAGGCRCGDGPPCDFINRCVSGACT